MTRTVADASATGRVILWEEHVGKLHVQETTSYELQNFVVKEWDTTKYLSRTKDSTILPIDDIGEVAETDHDNNLHELKNAHIIAVAKLDKHKACLRCKARVEPSSDEFRRCSKADCRMLQRYDFYTNHIYVKLVLMADEKIYTLSAYGKFVEDLASVL